MEDRTHDLNAAINILREELERVLRETREEGAEAYRKGDTVAFDRAEARRRRLQDFADRFEALCRDFRSNSGQARRRRTGPATTPRARKGELLPEKAYVFPILQVLQDRGGAVPKGEVLAELERVLGGQLTEADRSLLSNGQVRWQNRAAWVRNYLADAGLLTREGPKGVWRITDLGRRELAAGDLEVTWERMMQAKHTRRRGEG